MTQTQTQTQTQTLSNLRLRRVTLKTLLQWRLAFYAFYAFYALGVLFSVIGGPCKRYAVTPTRMPAHNCRTRLLPLGKLP